MEILDIRKFTPQDIKFLREYEQVYRHFANVLDYLQGEDAIYVGALLPMLTGLSRKLEYEGRQAELCAPLALALLDGIKKRFSEDFSNDRLIMASCVHPRFKTVWIPEPERCSEVWELVRTELKALEGPVRTASTADQAGESDSAQ